MVGASSEWTLNGVVMPCSVASKPARLALISPIFAYVQGTVTPSQLAGLGGPPAKCGGAGRPAHKVVPFTRRKNEQCVVMGNPIGRQAGEEFIESIVIRF